MESKQAENIEKTAVITTGSFYSKKSISQGVKSRQKWAQKLEKHEEEIRKLTIPSPYKISLKGPPSQWTVFFSQKDAFQFAKRDPQDLHVFAYESELLNHGAQGKRMYLTASYHHFWHYYRQLPESKRLHYEIIPEGAVCKLYFDLEFNKRLNPSKDGDVMVDSFIKFVCFHLDTMFGVYCDRSMVLDLDASTTEKFSSHLIFQLPGAVFRNNVHAGHFVRKICKKLIDMCAESNEKQSYMISDAPKTTTDLYQNTQDGDQTNAGHSEIKEVYKKQKMDPLVSCDGHTISSYIAVGGSEYSVKYPGKVSHRAPSDSSIPGKSTDLTVDDINLPGKPADVICDNRLLPRKSPQKGLERTKESSLSTIFNDDERCVEAASSHLHSECSVQDSKKLGICKEELFNLLVLDKHENRVLFCDLAVYTKNRNFRLYLSSKYMKNNPLKISKRNQYKPHLANSDVPSYELFLDSLINNVGFSNQVKILNCEDTACPVSRSRQREPSADYKGLESVEGYSHSPYPEVDNFISNNVIKRDGLQGYIRRWAYFSQGETLTYDIGKYRWCDNVQRQHRSNNIMIIADLKKGVYYQKCHDPECRALNYRSQNFSLPHEVLPAALFQDTLDGDEVDDIELFKAGIEAEESYYANPNACDVVAKQKKNELAPYFENIHFGNTLANSFDPQCYELSDAELMLAEMSHSRLNKENTGSINTLTDNRQLLDFGEEVSDSDMLSALDS